MILYDIILSTLMFCQGASDPPRLAEVARAAACPSGSPELPKARGVSQFWPVPGSCLAFRASCHVELCSRTALQGPQASSKCLPGALQALSRCSQNLLGAL